MWRLHELLRQSARWVINITELLLRVGRKVHSGFPVTLCGKLGGTFWPTKYFSVFLIFSLVLLYGNIAMSQRIYSKHDKCIPPNCTQNCLIIHTPHQHKTCTLPHDSVGKESACNAGDPDSSPWSGRSPGEGNSNPLQYSCLEKQTSLVGYSPWGHKWVWHDWVANTPAQNNIPLLYPH